MRVNNDRGLATGLTFRPLARIAGDMHEEYLAATDEQLASGYGKRGGLAWDQEEQLLADWHAG